jgi:hypothetical protein
MAAACCPVGGSRDGHEQARELEKSTVLAAKEYSNFDCVADAAAHRETHETCIALTHDNGIYPNQAEARSNYHIGCGCQSDLQNYNSTFWGVGLACSTSILSNVAKTIWAPQFSQMNNKPNAEWRQRCPWARHIKPQNHYQEITMKFPANFLSSFVTRLALLGMVALATGCASVNKAPASADAEAKQFKSNTATSQVYVYRNETLGAAISMPVAVDTKLAGTTGPNSYFKFDLPAGDHKITSQGDGSQISITTELGKLYFVWQEVKMGAFAAGSKLQLVAEDIGKKAVLECARIQSAF